jgi:hypothetical protein
MLHYEVHWGDSAYSPVAGFYGNSGEQLGYIIMEDFFNS